ncbi:hypothetical protein MVEN_01939000 [Mycena venus]|uniref:Uncharacterized protein n=1 Tax=Mycena venus TaxID=2733690 RepID=A0A8H6XGU9_9AGAR|nr:hypothetical protein MVEN_01939000 [Mycena venus]
MASSASSDADRLRIAIALTALKFKPANQSCASYVLQLRSVFPPSTPAAPTKDGSWKTHALALEKDLAGLKEKYEAEQIKTLLAPAAPASDSAPNNSQLVKRKPKKKAAEKRLDVPPHADLETVLEDLHNRPDFASLPTSDSLFSSFSAFQQFTSALSSSDVPVAAAQRSLLLSTTIRALTSLANVLHPILRSPEINVASQISTLKTLAALVHHLVSSSLPFLLRKPKHGTNQPATVSSLLNKLLDALVTSIFNPIVESFLPLSSRYLACLFTTTPSKSLPTDLRSDVLHLFQSAFSPLISAPSAYEVNLRATVALTALRELENLFPPRRTDNARLPQTDDDRVSTLVRKDALWYLCTVLHVLFAPPTDFSKSASTVGAVAERQIVDVFSRIANRCRKCQNIASKNATALKDACNIPDRVDEEMPSAGPPNNLDLDIIDEVGYQMILGVMERYWRWTGEVQQDRVM